MVEEASNYHLDQNKNNDLMIEKYKKTFKNLNHFENLLILSLGITACVSISVFASLICVTVGITSSLIETKICAFKKEFESISLL